MSELPPLSKLDVAQREINAAVTMLFEGGDPVAICVLASAARTIVGNLCEKKQDTPSFLRELLNDQPHLTASDYHKAANQAWNFFMHADCDPEGTLTGFKADDADSILFTAVFDFGALCKGKSIEAQVFEGWFLYRHGAAQDVPSGLDELFPNLPSLARPEALTLGKKVLAWARTVKDFQMTYDLEFRVGQ